MSLTQLHLLVVPLALAAACSSLTRAEPAKPPAPSTGLAFARASCASCHAVERSGFSHHSSAPSFPVIVNQEGLTKETLSSWLKGAHNYPSEMDFSLKEHEVDALITYMLTLRDRHFRRPRD